MTATRYATGIILGCVAIVPVVVGAQRLRRRFLPTLAGSAGALAVVVMVVAAVVAVAETLGSVGTFRRVATCAVLAIAGLVGCRIGGRPVASVETRGAVQVLRSPAVNVLATLTVALVAAAWLVRTVASLRHGMETVDTIWYHMPVAARFVQDGSITALHYVDSDPVTVFYPATSPLLHGFALQLLGNDFMSLFLNIGWLAIALLASWSIGAPFGVGHASLIGGAIVVATPGFVSTQPGGAYTDIVGLALFLTAVALLLHGRRLASQRAAVTVVAALAAGLALGTKFTFIVPVGALTLAVLLVEALNGARGRRWIHAAVAWCVPLVLIGGYFYVRNAVRVGNPLPQTAFGPLNLPTPPVSTRTFTVAQYLFDGSIWREFYIPGLWASLGPVWWAILAIAVLGSAVAVLAAREPLTRLLGLVVLATIVGYLVTPQFLGFPKRPVYFVFNVRYVSPAVALGLCILPTLPRLARPRVAPFVFGVYVAIIAATQIGPTVWSWSALALSRSQFHEGIATSDVVLGIMMGVLVAMLGLVVVFLPRRTIQWRGLPALVLTGLVLVGLVAGYLLQESYLRRRYIATGPLPTIYRWARDERDLRIGVIGINLQYPLAGEDASNYVQYIGRRGAHGAFSPYTSCEEWRRAINAAAFDYVLIAPRAFGLTTNAPEPRELGWTLNDGTSQVVIRDGPPGATAALVRLAGPLDPNACANQ